MKKLGIVCGIFAVSLPAAARADWQYTRWGMTPNEVVSASGGAAAKDGASGDLKARYQSGEYRFEATFNFKGGKLWSVDLNGVSGPQCFALTGDLKAKYGTPSEYYPRNETYWWLDRSTRNQIMVTTLASAKCILHYESLNTENNSGL